MISAAPSAPTHFLFVDESGAFKRSWETVCVGGILLGSAGTQVLTRRLADVFPHVPFPLHANRLHLVSSHLMGWLLMPPEGRDALASRTAPDSRHRKISGKLRTAYSELREALARDADLDERFAAYFESIDAGIEVGNAAYKMLSDVDEVLRLRVQGGRCQAG